MRLPRPSAALRPAAALLALAVLSSCTNNGTSPPDAGGGSVPVRVSCSTGFASVIVGSAAVEVLAQANRGAAAASGDTVSFTTNIGAISPAQAVTDTTGLALAFFQPPATPGVATIRVTVVDRLTGDTATSTCTIDVTQPRNPQLTVNLITPAAAAGLSVQVVYDASRVALPVGGAVALSPFNGAACTSIANDNHVGVAVLNIACSTLQASAGPVARFSFAHVAGPEASVSDFAVTCTAYDVRGVQLSAACSTSVLQL